MYIYVFIFITWVFYYFSICTLHNESKVIKNNQCLSIHSGKADRISNLLYQKDILNVEHIPSRFEKFKIFKLILVFVMNDKK